MSFFWIKNFGSYLLKPQWSHHTVEEDLQKVEVIFVCGLHELDPLDHDLVFCTIMLSFLLWNIANFTQTVQIGSPIDEEFELLSDFVLD